MAKILDDELVGTPGPISSRKRRSPDPEGVESIAKTICCVQGLLKHRCFVDKKLRFMTPEIRKRYENYFSYKRQMNCVVLLEKSVDLYVCITAYRIIWKSTASLHVSSSQLQQNEVNQDDIAMDLALESEITSQPQEINLLNEMPPPIPGNVSKKRRAKASIRCGGQGMYLGKTIHQCHDQQSLHRLTDDLRTKLELSSLDIRIRRNDPWNPTCSDLICDGVLDFLKSIPSTPGGTCQLASFYQHDCNAYRETTVRVSSTFRAILVKHFISNSIKTWNSQMKVCLNAFENLHTKEYCDLRLDVAHVCGETTSTIGLDPVARSKLLVYLAKHTYDTAKTTLEQKEKIFLCQNF